MAAVTTVRVGPDCTASTATPVTGSVAASTDASSGTRNRTRNRPESGSTTVTVAPTRR